MGKILVIDDEIERILDYLPLNLRDQGHVVDSCSGIAEGVTALGTAKAYDLVVLDIMFPLREKDDAAYKELTGRAPHNENDAMRAGLALVERIRSKGFPILVVTHVTRGTAKGREIRGELDQLQAAGSIVGVWEKPPADDFYKRVAEIAGRGQA